MFNYIVVKEDLLNHAWPYLYRYQIPSILYQIPSSFVAVLIFPYFGYIDSKVYYLEIFVNKFA